MMEKSNLSVKSLGLNVIIYRLQKNSNRLFRIFLSWNYCKKSGWLFMFS